MKLFTKLFTSAALFAAVALSIGPANAATLQARSQQLDAAGLPFWYQDITGAAAQPCLDIRCGLVVPNGTFNGTFPVSFPNNYPAEFFYWSAQSVFFPVGTFTADVLMALEVVFVNAAGNLVGPTAVGATASPFQRLNVTIAPPQGGQLPATGTLTAVGPWGTSTFDIATECGAPQNNKKCQIKRDLPAAAIPPINLDIPLGAAGFTVPGESVSTFLKQTAALRPAGFFGDGALPGITEPPATVTISGTLGTGSTNQWTITGQATSLDISPTGTQDFGVWNLGATSTPAKTFTVTNLTGAATSVPVITPPAGYTVTQGTCNVALTATGPGSSCTFSVAFAPTANGIASGNVTFNAAPAPPVTIVVTGAGDGVAPALTVDPINTFTKLTTQTITGTVTDNIAVGSVVVSVNGVAQAPLTAPPNTTSFIWSKLVTLPIANGANSISITATDTAQTVVNASATQTSTITTDTILPVVNVTAPAAGSLINNKTPTLTINVVEANPSFTNAIVDNAPVNPFPVTLGPLADGQHTVTITAGDSAGNSGTGSTTFTVDATPPAIAVTSPAPVNGRLGKTSPALTFTVTDANNVPANTTVTLDGTAVPAGTTVLGPFLAGSAHTLVVNATDGAGNPTTTTVGPFTIVLSDGRIVSLGVDPPSIADALVALRHSVQLTTLTGDAFAHGDVAPLDANGIPNPNGTIDISDALIILRRVVGLINTF